MGGKNKIRNKQGMKESAADNSCRVPFLLPCIRPKRPVDVFWLCSNSVKCPHGSSMKESGGQPEKMAHFMKLYVKMRNINNLRYLL
ncbi:hypothetical protein BRYFOR_06020 [Marvinbryantia formatexigens DSM 14469]|uniref:Uncharacterized protein n=1 Tax=Marvinbryantia formatexigens DSM 14469 TaxID=478749 RepID=C6LBM5_9FIRM|nr:hypothetical protein BRYFOR_06020 [Marvinbryantia formatexigens DSM 14469]